MGLRALYSSKSISERLAKAALMLALAATLAVVVPAVAYAEEVSQDDELYALSETAGEMEAVVDDGLSVLPADEGSLASGTSEDVGPVGQPAGADDEVIDPGDADQPQVTDDADQPQVTDVPSESLDGTTPTDDAQQDNTNQNVQPEEGAQDSQSSEADASQEGLSDEADVQEDDIKALENKGVALPDDAVSVKEGTYYLETGLANNQVLGVSKRKANASVCSCTYSSSDASTQTWRVVQDGQSGWYYLYLQNTSSGYVLGKHASNKKVVLLSADKLDELGDRALWAFVPNGTWCSLVNRAAIDYVLRFDDNSESGAKAKLGKEGSSSRKTYRFYLLGTKPKVKAGAEITEGAYTVAPKSNGDLAAETRGAKSSDGANVWLYTFNGKNHQKLYLEADGEGYYTVWVVGTGKVLAQESKSVIPGNNVVQKNYDSSAATQKWALRAFSDGTYALVNKATGLAMGATGSKSGSNLVGTRNDGYKTTRFKLKHKALLSAGIVEIHPRTNKAVALDVRGASTGTAGLLLWTNKDALNQRFELVSAGKTDCWHIRTASSGGWITYTGAEDAVVQQTGKGSDEKTKANTWRVTFKGGWYSLINLASGKALDMKKGKTDSGTKIIGYKPNGKDSQHFTFVQTTLIHAGYYFLQNGGERYLAVKNSSCDDGANIQVNDKSDAVGELFQFEQEGSSWSIQNAASELYLAAIEASKGSTVRQQEWTGEKTQLWKMVIVDGGSLAIRSVADETLGLVAYKAGAKNGADVYVTTAKQNDAQSWKPEELCDGVLTQKQEKVLVAALKTPSPGAGYCAAWVTNVFQNAGIGTWGGDACDQYRMFCNNSGLSKLKPGMIVAVSTHGHTQAGSIYGHVGIYIGNGLIMDNVGAIRTMSVFQWISYYSDRITAKWGWFGKALV